MPTPATSELPKPLSWDEFEDIVWDIYKRKWNDPDAQRYGRSGQAQQGVDVYGRPPELGGAYVGIQCKRYENLKLGTVIAEIEKAEAFEPPLAKLIIATTDKRDARLQEEVRLITQEREEADEPAKRFPVIVAFWEDLSSKLAEPGNTDLLAKHYGQWLGLFRLPFMQAPQLPSRYVERPAELERLKTLLLSVEHGAPPPVPCAILHGMSGVGKSVLAAAFGRDPAVQGAFPHGVLWVTSGTEPDIPQRLADWGRILKDPSVLKGPYPDAQAGTSFLRTALQDSACLLVVDDAWEKEHVEPFLVGGPRCLLLVTSRKADVLPDAPVIELDEMREEEALKLMANWAGEIPEADEATAVWLAEELGYLPLALELTGARVKSLGSWAEYRQRWKAQKQAAVRRGRRAKTAKDDSLQFSLALSLTGLHKDDREPYLQLGIFPEDTPFPASAAAVLWGWDAMEAEDFLIEDLVGQALLKPRIVDGEQRYTFHDVQRDFVVDRLGKEGSEKAHAALVAGYSAQCGGAWARLQPDGYIHDYLAWHMAKANLYSELYALIDKPWRDAQFERTFSHHTFARDVDLAIAAASEEPVNWEHLIGGCLIYASLGSMATNVPPEALGVLAQTGDPALLSKARGYATLIQDRVKQCDAFRLIGKALNSMGQATEAKEALGCALAAVEEAGNELYTPEALADIGQIAAQMKDQESLARTLAIAEAVGDEQLRANALTGVLEALVLAGETKMLHQASTAAAGIDDERLRAQTLSAVAQALASVEETEAAAEVAQQALAAVKTIEYDRLDRLLGDKRARANTLRKVAQALVQAGELEAVQQVLAAAATLENKSHRAEALSGVAQALAQAGAMEAAGQAAKQAWAAAQTVQDEWYEARALGSAAQALAQVGEMESAALAGEQALAAAQVLDDPVRKAVCLGRLAVPLARAGDAKVMDWVAEGALFPGDSIVALIRVARALAQAGSKEAAAQALQQALADTEAMGSEPTNVSTLIRIAETLGQEEEKEAATRTWEQALAAAQVLGDDKARVRALSKVSRGLAGLGMMEVAARAAKQAMAAAEAMGTEPRRVEVLTEVAQALAQAGEVQAAAEAALQALIEAEVVHSVRYSSLVAPIHFMRRETRARESAALAAAGGYEVAWYTVDALNNAARALAWAGGEKEAKCVAQRALVTAGTVSDEPPRVYSLSNVAETLAQLGEKEAAVDTAQRALSAAEALEDARHKVPALSRVAQALAHVGQQDEAVQTARLALEAIESIEDAEGKIEVLCSTMRALAYVGEKHTVTEAAQRAHALLREIKGEWPRLHALSGMAHALAQAGRQGDAAAAAQLALETAEAVERSWGPRGGMLRRVGLTLAQAGEKEAATLAFQLSKVPPEAKNWTTGEQLEVIEVAGVAIALLQGKTGEFWRQWSEARALRAKALSAVAQALAQTEATREVAYTAAHRALSEVSEIETEWDTAEALSEVAQALAQVGDKAAAVQTAQRAMSRAGLIADAWDNAEAQSALARVLAKAGRGQHALPIFLNAFNTARLAGPRSVLRVWGRAAPTLAEIDGGQTLAQVYHRVMEVESWWGA